MRMLWDVRRRPSMFGRVLRGFLMIGSAVAVPVGLEVLRRVALRRGLFARAGRALVEKVEKGEKGASIAREAIANGTRRRRRRPATAERS